MRGNKIRQKLCVVLLAGVLALSSSGCGAAAGSGVKKAGTYDPLPVYKYTFGLLGEDEMPVVMFGGPIDGFIMDGYKPETMINDNIYRYYKEAGVNGIVGTANWVNGDRLDEVTRILNYTEKYRINYVTFDTSLIWLNNADIPSLDDENVKQRLDFYEQYESFAGIYCQDEARMEYLDELAKAHQFVFDYNEKNGTNLIAYSNMHPYWTGSEVGYYSTDYTNKQYDYEMMIRGFMDKGKLPYLSYDRYSLLRSAGDDQPGTLDQEWFENLALIRGWAQEYQIPFWVCLPVGGWGALNKAPNEPEFQWLVNSALACGAKGIEYFPGVQPTSDDYMEVPNGELGLVAMDGQKTKYYYYSKNVTAQIRACQKYLMNAASVGILVDPASSPDSNISNDLPFQMPDGYTFLLDEFRELRSVSDNGLVGCFDYKGRTMLYVMNNTLEDEVDEVTLKFDGAYGYSVIQRGIVRSTTGKTLTLNLNGGEGALVLLK